MKNNKLIFNYFLLFFLSSCNTYHYATTQKSDRPNILFILSDDQGYPTLGCYGAVKIRTPHLDDLAASGTRFTNAYVTSQCTPTRATLLTGQYTARSGMWHVIKWYGYPWAHMTEPPFKENLSRNDFVFSKGLQEMGYTTGIIGKWHLTNNADGTYMGLRPEAAPYYGFDSAPPVINGANFEMGADRGVALYTKQALEFIKANKERPWFCFLSHHMIHGNVVAPDSLVEKYRSLGFDSIGPNRAVYLAGLELLDWSVGKLLNGLKNLGEYHETVVIFMSDNGGIKHRLDFRAAEYLRPEGTRFDYDIHEYNNDPLRAGKGSIYEGGVKVPFVFSWPGQYVTGQVNKTPVHAIDLAPTLLEMAGYRGKNDWDGKSLVPLLRGHPEFPDGNRPLFQYFPFYDLLWGLTPSASIRDGKYKLIRFFGDYIDSSYQYHTGARTELYDLITDPGETKNLIEHKPQIRQDLDSKLDSWLEEMEVSLPDLNPHFEPAKAFQSTSIKPDWIGKH